MPRLMQVWQYGPGAAAEKGLDDAIVTASTFELDGLLVKAIDGNSFMSEFSRAGDAIGSVEQAAQQRDRCHAAGLKFFTWTNPLHDVDLDRQAGLTADLALASDGLFLDVEPYSGHPPFWGPFRPRGLARGFMETVRNRAPDVFLALQPDPRPGHMTEIRSEEWLPHVDVLAGQHYWTDFGADATQELTRAQALGVAVGKEIWPTIPGNADAASVPSNLLASFPGFVVWRLGTTGPDMLKLLRGIPSRRQEPVKPPDTAGLVNALAYVCDDLGDQIDEALHHRSPDRQKIGEAVQEMRRVREQFLGSRPG